MHVRFVQLEAVAADVIQLSAQEQERQRSGRIDD